MQPFLNMIICSILLFYLRRTFWILDQSHHFCLQVLSGLDAAAVIGVYIVAILLEVELNVPIEPPEGSRPRPQDDLLLRILPSDYLSHPVLVDLPRGSTEFSLEGTVIVEGLVDLDDGEGHDLITALVEVEDVQSGVVLLETGLEDEVQGEPISACVLAESRGLLEGRIEVAVVSREAVPSDLIHGLEDVLLGALVTLVVESLSAVQQLLRRKSVTLVFIQRNCIGNHLGQFLGPCIARADALSSQAVVGVFDDTGLHTHVELRGNCQCEGHHRQEDDQSLHLIDLYSTTIIKSLGGRRQWHLGQLDVRHLNKGGFGRQGQRVNTALGQRNVHNGLLSEGFLCDYRCIEDQCGHLTDSTWFVLCQQPFGKTTMLLSLGIFLDCIFGSNLSS